MSLLGGDGALQVVLPMRRVVVPGRCRLYGQGAAGRTARARQGVPLRACRSYRQGAAGCSARDLKGVLPGRWWFLRMGPAGCSANSVVPGRPCGTRAGAQPAESPRRLSSASTCSATAPPQGELPLRTARPQWMTASPRFDLPLPGGWRAPAGPASGWGWGSQRV